MDLEQLALLDDVSKERYVTLERMFDTPGWKLVEEWAKTNAQQQFHRAALAGSWEENRMALGARLAYEVIAGLRDSTEAEFIAKAEDAALNGQYEEEALNE